ncbi:hypothetical protein MXD61_05175 [Frankia sp. AgPm24]|uniref:hypothetical protein n=1 Tax=Frankia sp. AgPm24 TaxID=631128 RepID=UPI0020104EE4|nr:hypothetical protein [Frankia sp. AgPm24]MCK9921298.1 hypothetical protein [Frankia sp. AgPm24]
MKVGCAHSPALTRALREAGVLPWSPGLRLHAGDILVLDPALDPGLLRHVRGLLLPDVETLLLEEEPPGAGGAGWPWRRLRLPEDLDDLTRLRTVVPVTTLTAGAGTFHLNALHLEVRDRLPRHRPHPADPPPDDGHPMLTVLRAAFAYRGLPWPEASTLTLRWTAPHPPSTGVSVAVAAAVLAATGTGTITPAALRRYAFVGDVAANGRLRRVRNLPGAWDAAHAAGYRHLVTPTTRAPVPRGAVHPIATVADLLPLLRL